MKLSLILKLAGILVGIIVAVTLVSLYPIKILILAASAGVYFIGDFIAKKGK